MEEQDSAEKPLKQTESPKPAHSTEVSELQQQLVTSIQRVAEFPQEFERLEAEHEFAEQFERRSGILREAGLTTDINGSPIEYPSYAEIRAKILENPELLTKMKQGFVRLQPVPVGAPLSAYFEAMEAALREYAKQGKLRGTDGTNLILTTNKPAVNYFGDADRDGSLVYEPARLTKGNHGGKTKKELIAERGPIQILFSEDLRDIPREGEGKSIGNRPQIEAGESAKGYLEMLGKPPYEKENAYTPEAWMTHLLTHLHETEGEVLDNCYRGTSDQSIAPYCPGSWLPGDCFVPYAYFVRDGGQLGVRKREADRSYSFAGIRSGVKVS